MKSIGSLRFWSLALIAMAAFYSRAFAAGIAWEAEDALLVNDPLQLAEDANASGEKYIFSPVGDQGSAEYEFRVPKDGIYFLWGRHISKDGGSNSAYLVIDDPESPIGNNDLVWDTHMEPLYEKLEEEVIVWGREVFSPEWLWMRVIQRTDQPDPNVLEAKIRVFDLEAGKHKMYLWAREPTKIDCFYLTDEFDEEPVFPGEDTGFADFLVGNPKGKLSTTWGGIKGEH